MAAMPVIDSAMMNNPQPAALGRNTEDRRQEAALRRARAGFAGDQHPAAEVPVAWSAAAAMIGTARRRHLPGDERERRAEAAICSAGTMPIISTEEIR